MLARGLNISERFQIIVKKNAETESQETSLNLRTLPLVESKT